jgi:3',5'-nucleoside bisphosphate phosphatase
MIDLHLHTIHSDGKKTVPELAEMIKKSGLTHCSLTDHDSVDGVAKLQQLLKKSKNITVIPGVELSVMYKQQELHILAYGFDVTKVKRILAKKSLIVMKKREKELRDAKRLFRKNGFVVSRTLKTVSKQPVGLTIALDVYNNPQNQHLIKNRSFEAFYYDFQAPGTACYVERSGVDIAWIMKHLRSSVSNLILGHPFNSVSLLIKPLSKQEIKRIVGLGLDGVEIYHPELTKSQIKSLEDLVNKNSWCFTGGSDFHGKHKSDRIGLGYLKGKHLANGFKLFGY